MANQYTAHPKDWTWAMHEYGQTPTPAEVIAVVVGCSLTYLYARMNRSGIAKYKAHPVVKAGTRDTYRPVVVEAAEREDLSRRDAIVLAAHPLIRCPECCAVSRSNRCVCGAVKNPFLAVD